MKKKSNSEIIIKIIFIILIISFRLESQENITDQKFQSEQIKTLKGICKELDDIENSLNINNSTLKELNDSINISITKGFSKNSEKLSETINTLHSNENDDDLFYWYEFISNVIVEILGAFIGFGGALFLYYYQKKNDDEEERSRKKKENESRVKYLKQMLSKAIPSIKKQMDFLKSNISATQNKPIYIDQIHLIPNDDLERLKRLFDNHIYYEAFASEVGNTVEDLKNYTNIMASNDYFLAQFNELKKSDAVEFDHSRKLEYKYNFEKALDMVSKLGESHQNTGISIYDEIGNILDQYHKNNIPDKIETHQDYFIEPARNLLLDKYYELPGSRECLELLKKITQDFNNIKAQNNHHAEYLNQLYNTMREAYNVLKNASDKLGKNDSK